MNACLPSQTGLMGSLVRMRVVFVLLWYAIVERGKRGWIGWYDSTVVRVLVQVHALYIRVFSVFFFYARGCRVAVVVPSPRGVCGGLPVTGWMDGRYCTVLAVLAPRR